MPPPKHLKKIDPDVDISEDTDNSNATPADLEKIAKMADRVAELDVLLGEEDDYIKTLKEEKNRIESISLPEAMMSCGMKEFKTHAGASVKIVDFVEVNLPAAGAIDKAKGDDKVELEERLKEGLKFIDEHGGSSIIKSVVLVDFERGQSKAKQTFFDALIEKGYAAISADTVHPQTLKAWVKEKISNGVPVPAEPFKLYCGSRAEVKLPVKKK